MKKSIGVLGGGQLGKMLFEAGSPLNTSFVFLEKSKDCPASLVCNNQIVGSLFDAEKIEKLADKSEVLTYEIEHVNVDILYDLEKRGTPVFPKPSVLSIIQDKGIQKDFYTQNQVPTLDYTLSSASQLVEKVSAWPEDQFVLKHRKGGYDGKGVQLLDKQRFNKLANKNDEILNSEHGYVIEKLAKDAIEVSVIVSVDQLGNRASYEPCEMIFDPKSNLMDYLIAPSRLDSDINKQCETIAVNAVNAFDSPGLFAVELFVQKNGAIYVNEIAPRPHNSGHHTIESTYTSQYEQLNRILLGQPLGDTSLITPAATCNIVGPQDVNGPYYLGNLNKVLAISGVYIHMYGKASSSPFRKLGHFTVLAATRDEVITKMETVKSLLTIKSN
ncbi:MAG: 5-(carboxyamino)imidazole ribonucleotide synthase [Bacteroidetes bacterium]|nr:MAG: 5-(carboxyamino)imidazole ribonucleotide synthase [Bacteroidota bacterium]